MAWQKRGEDADGGKFNGGTWHIFPHVIEKTYNNGVVEERMSWRGVVNIGGRLIWKANQNKEIVEKWVKDKLGELYEPKKPKHRKHDDDSKEKRAKTRKQNRKKKGDAWLKELRARQREERQRNSQLKKQNYAERTAERSIQ